LPARTRDRVDDKHPIIPKHAFHQRNTAAEKLVDLNVNKPCSFHPCLHRLGSFTAHRVIPHDGIAQADDQRPHALNPA
jgi:hypothetical protein